MIAEAISGEVIGGGVLGGVSVVSLLGWLFKSLGDRTADLAASRAEMKEILVKSASDADARAKEMAQSIAARAKADEAVAEAMRRHESAWHRTASVLERLEKKLA